MRHDDATGEANVPAGRGGEESVLFRAAVSDDVPGIVSMLADDELGAAREAVDRPDLYAGVFKEIDADPRQLLIIAERGGALVGTLQLTLIPGLSRKGATRALIEAVRVHSSARGSGLGSELIRHAIEEARRRGAALVQLTTDARRTDAHRFYEKLGFEASHIGFKLQL